jgi:hypothetical protein
LRLLWSGLSLLTPLRSFLIAFIRRKRRKLSEKKRKLVRKMKIPARKKKFLVRKKRISMWLQGGIVIAMAIDCVKAALLVVVWTRQCKTLCTREIEVPC